MSEVISKKSGKIVLSPAAFARLSSRDAGDPEAKAQIDALIELVTEWTKCPKPNLAVRAGKLLAKMEALRRAVVELRVSTGVIGVKPKTKADFDALGELGKMALAVKRSSGDVRATDLRLLELYVRCVSVE